MCTRGSQWAAIGPKPQGTGRSLELVIGWRGSSKLGGRPILEIVRPAHDARDGRVPRLEEGRVGGVGPAERALPLDRYTGDRAWPGRGNLAATRLPDAIAHHPYDLPQAVADRERHVDLGDRRSKRERPDQQYVHLGFGRTDLGGGGQAGDSARPRPWLVVLAQGRGRHRNRSAASVPGEGRLHADGDLHLPAQVSTDREGRGEARQVGQAAQRLSVSRRA